MVPTQFWKEGRPNDSKHSSALTHALTEDLERYNSFLVCGSSDLQVSWDSLHVW